MDQGILRKNGLNPSNPRVGYLKDYGLRIGNRASLIPSKGEKAYGIVISVDDEATNKLYAEPSVADYIPEEVEIITTENGAVSAICYNLPANLLTGTNTSYATSLHELASKEGFPEEYLDKIKAFANPST